MSILHLTTADFKESIANGRVLVDFWAGWCGPCKMLAPVIDELAAEKGDKVKVAKVDVDAEGALAAEYGVMGIPTVILFEDGKEKERFVGVRAKEDYVAAIDA